jgi:hypothetical protein
LVLGKNLAPNGNHLAGRSSLSVIAPGVIAREFLVLSKYNW